MKVKDEIFDGFGAFCYPGLISISDSKPTPEKIQAGYRNIKVKHLPSDGPRIVVTDDGFFGIIVEDEEKALTFLNVLFAAGKVDSGHE